MARHYKKYSLFDEVANSTLQTFNRCVTLGNINEDIGYANATKYLGMLEDNEKLKISLMLQYIKEKGIEFVRREISRGDNV